MDVYVRNVTTGCERLLGIKTGRLCLGVGVELVRLDMGYSVAKTAVKPTTGRYVRIVYTPHPSLKDRITATVLGVEEEDRF